jgi:hypothetical protein
VKKNTSQAEDDKLFTVTQLEKVKPLWETIINTLVCSTFLVVGALSALSLRNDLNLPQNFKDILGDLLLAFVVAVMLTLVYKANKR